MACGMLVCEGDHATDEMLALGRDHDERDQFRPVRVC